MRKAVSLLAMLGILSLSGCSYMSPVKVGKRTTVYQPDGRTVAAVEQEIPIGDKYNDYGSTVQSLGKSSADAESQAIAAVLNVNAPRATDTDVMSMAKAAMSSLAIVAIKAQNRLDLIVQNVKYGKDGYDVADTVAGGFVNLIGSAVPWLSVASMVKHGFQAAGDTTNVGVNGDSNYVDLRQDKTNTNTNINSVYTADGDANGGVSIPNSPSITNASPSETVNEVPVEEPIVEEPIVEE